MGAKARKAWSVAMSVVMALSMISATALTAFADEVNDAMGEAQNLVYGDVYGIVDGHAMVVNHKTVYEDVYGNETTYPCDAYDVDIYNQDGECVISTVSKSLLYAAPYKESDAGYAIFAYSFYELNGLLAVSRDGGHYQGVVDLDGNEVIGMDYTSLQYFTDQGYFIGIKWSGDEAIVDILSRAGDVVYSRSLGNVAMAGLQSLDEYFQTMSSDVFSIYTMPLGGSKSQESYWKIQNDGSLIPSSAEELPDGGHVGYMIDDDRYYDRDAGLIRDSEGNAISERLLPTASDSGWLYDSWQSRFAIVGNRLVIYDSPNVYVFDKNGQVVRSRDISLWLDSSNTSNVSLRKLTTKIFRINDLVLDINLEQVSSEYILPGSSTYTREIIVDGVEPAYYYCSGWGSDQIGRIVDDSLQPVKIAGRELILSGHAQANYRLVSKPTVQYDGNTYYLVLGDNGKIGMTNAEGEVVLPFEYDNHFCALKDNEPYIMLQKDGAWQFMYLADFLKIDPIDISTASISAAEFVYDGKSAVAPALTVKDGDKVLSEGVDYEVGAVEYDLCAGSGTATVEGIGAYAGSASVSFAVTVPAALRFPDVAQPEWYYESCAFAKANGLISGYDSGDFGPGDTLTRAQAAAILQRYFAPAEADSYDAAAAANETGMDDVAGACWYTGAANWAVREGVINGKLQDDGSRLFDPDGVITREQLCAIVGNAAAKWCGAAVEGADRAKLYGLLGSELVSDWAVDSVAWGVNAGVINGVATDAGRDVAAGANVERSVMAAVMMNAIQNGVIGR